MVGATYVDMTLEISLIWIIPRSGINKLWADMGKVNPLKS